MNKFEIEKRLKQARVVAAAPRSIVDQVMRQLPLSLPKPVRKSFWDRRVFAASLAVPTMIAATLVCLLFFTGPALRLTLADIEAAVEQQAWLHIKYDVGSFEQSWTNLRTGESFTVRTDGSVIYINQQANKRLWYWKPSGAIQKDKPVLYGPGQSPPAWTPRTAWEQIVAPLEQAIAVTDGAATTPPVVASVQDTLNGKALIRYDSYGTDSLGKRILHAQLWADPKTHLPVRLRTRLQLGERERAGKEWSTGDYDFPANGPADLYELGVPRTAPVTKDATAVSAEVQEVVDGINRSHDNFLKNYRAIVWNVLPKSPEIDGLDIIWRYGDKLRHDHHLPGMEVRENHAPALPRPNPAELLAWAAQSDATVKQLMNGDREYTWRSAYFAKTEKPQVHVIPHKTFPLLDQNDWPERIQWPTRHFRPNFQVLDENADAVAGCVGLRSENGNLRWDYYIDTGNDFVCVKQISWTMRNTEWAKTREDTLSGLRRIESRVVASSATFVGYADPIQGFSGTTTTKHIDLVPLAPTDYPPGIFDPASLTTGAIVEAY